MCPSPWRERKRDDDDVCWTLQVIDTYNPEFKERLDRLVKLNVALIAIKGNGPMELLQRLPLFAGFASELIGLFVMKPLDSGSVDMASDAQLVY